MKRLDTWRTAQISEINQLADSIESILTPSQIRPKTLHDYPTCLEMSDKLKRICQLKEKELKDQVQNIKDSILKTIESEKVVLKFNRAGIPEYKKKYTTAAAQERELRSRLVDHETYSTLETERGDWELMAKDWRSHYDKLRREMRLLEADYLHNGGTSITLSN
jgi:hypothetical protein